MCLQENELHEKQLANLLLKAHCTNSFLTG